LNLYRIESKYFVVAFFADTRIRKAASILKWAIDKEVNWFRKYCRQKGWKLLKKKIEE